MFCLSSLSLISEWILQTWTFISSLVVTVVIVLGASSGKGGYWGWDQIVFSFFVNNSYRMLHFLKKALFSLVWHTKMSSVFRTGQSTNSMARLMKDNQMSNVCASSHEYPHVEKNQESSWTVKGTVAQPTVTGKELTSGQKEKPHGKKKNLTAKRKPHSKKKVALMGKRITSWQKE